VNNLADKLVERYTDAKMRRSVYDNTLTLTAQYVWPPMQDIVRSVASETEGRVLTVNIYNSTAQDAAKRMTAGIFSYLMPIGTQWFEFMARLDKMNKDPNIKLSLADAGQQVHQAIWRSNFRREMFITIRSLCVFGTGIISVEKLNGEIVYRAYHIGDMFFEENYKGEIDTVFRRMTYTARQAKQAFKSPGDSVEKELKADQTSKSKFEFVHCVFPNTDYDAKVGSKPYVSLFLSMADKQLVEPVSPSPGYDAMPYKIARFTKAPGEIMGRSPGTENLPDIKMLDRMTKAFIFGAEMASGPPLIIEEESVVGQPVYGPFGKIVISPGSKPPEPLKTGVNTALNSDVILHWENKIRSDFYNDLFNALANYRNMTATEVVERIEEKMVLLAPSISSLQKELLDPLILRTLDLLDLDLDLDFDMDIVYQGRLALAMSNMQSNAIEAVLAKWQPYSEQYPVFDNIDLDDSFRTTALNAGVPPDVLVDPDVRDERRQAEQDKQDMALATQLAETGSKAYKNVNQTIEPDSLAAVL